MFVETLVQNMGDEPQSTDVSDSVDLGETEIDVDDPESLVTGVLSVIKLLMNHHEKVPVADALESYRDKHGRRAVDQLVFWYFRFGGWLLYKGLERDVFEVEGEETSLSDESEMFERMLESAVIGTSAEEGGPKIVSCTIDVEVEPYDEAELFDQLVNGSVTRDEFRTYLSRGDVEKLQDALIESDTEVWIEHPESGAVIDFIYPDGEELTAHVDDE